MKKKMVSGLMIVIAAAGAALAAPAEPALLHGIVTEADRALTRSALAGAERFKAETGLGFRDFAPDNVAQGEQAIRNFAARGFNPVVLVSPAWRDAVAQVAADYPETRFILVGTEAEAANIRSITFRDEEAAYLAGVLAGLASVSGRIGFLANDGAAGDRSLFCAYRQGARQARPDIAVDEIADAGNSAGADVLLAPDAAAPTRPGILPIALVRHAEAAVHEALLAAQAAHPGNGRVTLGVKEGGVDYALGGPYPADAAVLAGAEKARAALISGGVTVKAAAADGRCGD